MSNKNGKLLLDKVQSYGTYDTDAYQNLDGTAAASTSSALSTYSLYRLKCYVSDTWIKIGANPTAVSGQGILMSQYDELILQVNANDKISAIGGKLNIVPII